MVPSKAARRRATPRRPVPGAGVGAAVAVVADDDAQQLLGVLELDPGGGGLGVLGRVGQALGDGEVEPRLDRGRRSPGQRAGDLHGHGHVEGQRAHRAVETAVGQHRRVDAAHHVAQVGQGGLGGGPRLLDRTAGAGRVVLELRLGHPQAHRHGHQPGLGAVVQVALEPAQLGGGVVDGGGAAAGQHLDAPLEPLGAAGAQQHAVDAGAHRHERVRAVPPEPRGQHAEQQHHHEQREHEPHADRPQQPHQVAPGHRVGQHRAQAQQRTALRHREVRRRHLGAEHPTGHRALPVRDDPQRGHAHDHQRDADPDDRQDPARDDQDEEHREREHQRDLLRGVRRDAQAARSLPHRPILADAAPGCSGAGTTTPRVRRPLTAPPPGPRLGA